MARSSKYLVAGSGVPRERVRRLFNNKKTDAKQRGIPFLLTFEEWLSVWMESGKLSEAGCRLGQYVMARNGDSGPYALGNVRIALSSENNKEKTMSEAGRRAIGAAQIGHQHGLGKTLSAETRAKISASLSARYSR